MPIYKYKCTDVECEYEFEALQTMKEGLLKVCPECRQEDVLEKCISIINFRLLGEGWFKDGYDKN